MRKKTLKLMKQQMKINEKLSSNIDQVKYMSFISKIDETSNLSKRAKSAKSSSKSRPSTRIQSASTMKTEKKSISSSVDYPRKSALKSAKKLALDNDSTVTKETLELEKVEVNSTEQEVAAEPEKVSNYTEEEIYQEKQDLAESEKEIKQIEMYNCLNDGAVMCECFENAKNEPMHPTTPLSPLRNQKSDIFHLTEGEDRDDHSHSSNVINSNKIVSQSDNEIKIEKHDLREILLSNYDPKFAAKIGIGDFIPIEIMNGHLDEHAPPLEFIPFENIDKNYPK